MNLVIEVILTILIAVVLVFAKFWLIGSLFTSGIKAISDKCNTTYAIERVVDGHWFCPVEAQ
jgi:hypothetical protein